MRAALAVIAFLAAASAAPAGQGSAVFENLDGTIRLRVTVTDPRGEVGAEHFQAMRFGFRENAAAAPRPLRLSRESLAEIPPRGIAAVRGSKDDTGRFLVDWSDVTAELRVEGISACIAGLLGEVEGTLPRGKSTFLMLDVSMAHVSVLTSVKGDADLYVYNAVGGLVCASQVPREEKLPDQCAYLASDCGTLYVPESLIEIRGLWKRNDFHLSIWVVDAI